ncbi:hypothetical protein AMATHDRAFT_44931 [Amanita thiersii Skay4041]|uniref:HPt domain-containing protein n=1 Tax=Amanita thiersii Skay4041 TaxID=703135 RepID=A0A2A9P0I3_9AGAR|nr:hypothetical protein AMATHDRAFT_44931 [Amanita thiersii Skay4041]
MSTTNLPRPLNPISPSENRITSCPEPSPPPLKPSSPLRDRSPPSLPSSPLTPKPPSPPPPPSLNKSSSPEPPSSPLHDDKKPEKLESKEEATEVELPVIDMDTFQQLLELDEDGDDLQFSKGMVDAYFDQAAQTFNDMDIALGKKDLKQLSALGHYFKGSSAALGVARVQHSCEKIQHYGQCRDEEAGTNLSEQEALDKITALLSQAKGEYAAAEDHLKAWYADRLGPEP